jgi:starvation-inducible DNA-binding protein
MGRVRRSPTWTSLDVKPTADISDGPPERHRCGDRSIHSTSEGGLMYPTKSDQPEATRRQVIDLCNARLADAIDLQTQTKQAHWNVKGPHFIALHELFDKVNAEVEDYVDLIAERAVQLGGAVEGTARSVAKRSTLAE